ncbi:MAG: hypothetical protein HY260_05780, partial [Chloroflexi bacterium]|nr:hypothetical protein [Chloroflexota bacterium]
MTFRRLAVHSLIIGVIAGAIYLFKLPWGKWALPVPAVAAVVEATDPAPASFEHTAAAHAAHLADPPTL